MISCAVLYVDPKCVCVCVQEYGIFSAGDRDAGDAGESDRMDLPSEVHDPGGTGETDGMDELELCESSNIDLFAFTVCSFDPGVTETSRWAIPHVSLRLCQHHSSSSKRHTSCSAMTMTMTHSEKSNQRQSAAWPYKRGRE